MSKLRIPREVARKIGYYVYLYVDPRNNRPFYVGKGRGPRAVAHLGATGESKKARTIRAIRRAGLKPRIDILAHGLRDEETAFRLEAAVIDALRLERLTNVVRGSRSLEFGRLPLRDLIAHYRAKPVAIRHPVVLIRINKLYYPGMSERALYEATRGVWRLNRDHASRVKFAFAVFEGVVREVFTIRSWVPAGSTPYKTRPLSDVKVPGRSEFVGEVASNVIRRRYVDHSIRRHFRQGLQSPVVYRNC